MARRRNGRCSTCGDHIQFPYKGRKCKACKAPAVRAAKTQLRRIRRDDQDEVEIEVSPRECCNPLIRMTTNVA